MPESAGEGREEERKRCESCTKLGASTLERLWHYVHVRQSNPLLPGSESLSPATRPRRPNPRRPPHRSTRTAIVCPPTAAARPCLRRYATRRTPCPTPRLRCPRPFRRRQYAAAFLRLTDAARRTHDAAGRQNAGTCSRPWRLAPNSARVHADIPPTLFLVALTGIPRRARILPAAAALAVCPACNSRLLVAGSAAAVLDPAPRRPRLGSTLPRTSTQAVQPQ